MTLGPLLAVGMLVGLVTIGVMLLVTVLRVRLVSAHEALIVATPRGLKVALGGRVLTPILHRAEVMDLRVVPLVVERSGARGLMCRDHILLSAEAVCLFRPKPYEADLQRIAETIGVQRASDPDTLRNLFESRCAEALAVVALRFDSDELLRDLERVREAAIEQLGTDLQGYDLEDLLLTAIAPAPLSAYDPNNVLHAKGLERLRNRDQAAEE